MPSRIPLALIALALIGADPHNREGDMPAGKSCCDDLALAVATCTGSASCRACKNCSNCKHCKGGGTCGVCSPARSEPERRPEPPPAAPPSRPSAPKPEPDRVPNLLLELAASLESTNRAESIRAYGRVVEQYREHSAADKALARLKALESKPDGEWTSAGPRVEQRLKQAKSLEKPARDAAAEAYLEIVAEAPDSIEGREAATRLEALGLPSIKGIPSIEGRWAESSEVEFVVRQRGDRFAASVAYVHPEAGMIRAVVSGHITRDGAIVASWRHTQAPREWQGQRREAKLSDDGQTIRGRAAWRGGGHEFTWTRLEPEG